MNSWTEHFVKSVIRHHNVLLKTGSVTLNSTYPAARHVLLMIAHKWHLVQPLAPLCRFHSGQITSTVGDPSVQSAVAKPSPRLVVNCFQMKLDKRQQKGDHIDCKTWNWTRSLVYCRRDQLHNTQQIPKLWSQISCLRLIEGPTFVMPNQSNVNFGKFAPRRY